MDIIVRTADGRACRGDAVKHRLLAVMRRKRRKCLSQHFTRPK